VELGGYGGGKEKGAGGVYIGCVGVVARNWDPNPNKRDMVHMRQMVRPFIDG